MSKNFVFMRDIVCKYHPAFKRSADLRHYGIKHNDIFNIERLIEESLAAVGGYDFVDEEGYDFNDIQYSDSKTVSVVNNGGAKQTKVIIISSVENKIGSLRVTIYNPFKESIDFLYIPKKDVQRLMENAGTTGTANKLKQRIRTSWNPERDDYNKLEQYRVGSFKELARAKG
jgi:hypothetical protein